MPEPSTSCIFSLHCVRQLFDQQEFILVTWSVEAWYVCIVTETCLVDILPMLLPNVNP